MEPVRTVTVVLYGRRKVAGMDQLKIGVKVFACELSEIFGWKFPKFCRCRRRTEMLCVVPAVACSAVPVLSVHAVVLLRQDVVSRLRAVAAEAQAAPALHARAAAAPPQTPRLQQQLYNDHRDYGFSLRFNAHFSTGIWVSRYQNSGFHSGFYWSTGRRRWW